MILVFISTDLFVPTNASLWRLSFQNGHGHIPKSAILLTTGYKNVTKKLLNDCIRNTTAICNITM